MINYLFSSALQQSRWSSFPFILWHFLQHFSFSISPELYFFFPFLQMCLLSKVCCSFHSLGWLLCLAGWLLPPLLILNLCSSLPSMHFSGQFLWFCSPSPDSFQVPFLFPFLSSTLYSWSWLEKSKFFDFFKTLLTEAMAEKTQDETQKPISIFFSLFKYFHRKERLWLIVCYSKIQLKAFFQP